MRMILLNKWVRSTSESATTALVSIPAAKIERVEQADQFALTEAQLAACRSGVLVKGFGWLYVSQTVEQITDHLNGGK